MLVAEVPDVVGAVETVGLGVVAQPAVTAVTPITRSSHKRTRIVLGGRIPQSCRIVSQPNTTRDTMVANTAMIGIVVGFVLHAHDAWQRSTAAAARLHQLGLRHGDRIGIIATPTIAPGRSTAAQHDAARTQADVAVLAFAALRAGIVPVMINPLLTPREFTAYLDDAQVAQVVTHAGQAQELAAPAPETGTSAHPELSDVPLGRPMHFTSGTTGRSKGVWAGVLDHDTATRYWRDEHEQWPITDSDRVLNFGPLAHSAPLRFSMLAFLAGADMIYLGPFSAELTSAAIATHRPTVAMAVPTHLQRFLTLPGNPPPSSFRMLVHAGSACPPDLKRAIHRWAGVSNVWEFLGSTEGQFTACRGSEWEERPGTLGRARVGRALLIDDGTLRAEGLIWCSAPPYARFEYFRDPGKTDLAWRTTGVGDAFTVGDLGRLDADGYLYLHGRRTDLIVTGGVNVYPADVEAAMRECPGVHDVAVFAGTDPRWGQRVCAAVVGAATVADIDAWCHRELAGYRRPKQIVKVPELPLTANGKVVRDGLAAWVTEHAAS